MDCSFSSSRKAGNCQWWIWILCVCAVLFITVDGQFICLGNRKNSSCVSVRERVRESFFQTVCYARIGCFYSGPPFYHPVHRPITIPPQSPDIIQPQYMLFTRRNRYRAIFLSDGDTDTLHKSTFNPGAHTRILINGYLDSQGVTLWSLRAKDIILDKTDDNVILYDWSAGAGVRYSVAIANARVAGALLANMIHFLCENTGTDPALFHIIGHSLGVHVCGYAGERVPGLGRITGLDPAGPGFNYMPPEVILDPSDALFVDNFHTDPGEIIVDGLGTSLDAGHLDFWPWDGEQPKVPYCPNRIVAATKESPPTEVTAQIVACRHTSSEEYFNYSFNQSNCLFVGVKCRSWEDFLAGHCDCGETGERCSIAGFYAEPPSPLSKLDDLRYYFKSDPKRPYCVHQYRLKITIIHNTHIRKRKELFKEYGAEVILIGEENDLEAKIKLKIKLRKRKQVLQFLVTNEEVLGAIHSAVINFEKENYAHNETVQWYDHNHFTVDKVEVTYLYPLPKIHTEFLLCGDPECFQSECKNELSFMQEHCHS